MRRALLPFVILVVGYVAVTGIQVAYAARPRPPQQVDAIVVLGAAQYNGRPSPALKARLDRAAELYRQGMAPEVWVTGGQQPGDRFSEASASDLYLQNQGVPRSALKLETQGVNTYQSISAAARYLRNAEARRVLLVSDAWHSYRLLATAREVGLVGSVSPPPTDLFSALALRRVSRETLLVSVGRFIGYRRLANLQDGVAPP